MRITGVRVSVFEMPPTTRFFALNEEQHGPERRWKSTHADGGRRYRHVLHVDTDEGIEGICTVGDVRYTTMTGDDLAQLRLLAVGEDPTDRERLHEKLRKATRHMFAPHGWAGSFDNCLWDIAGKAAGLPVSTLMGRARREAPCYFNIRGASKADAVDDTKRALSLGFTAVKDHFGLTAPENIEWFEAIRDVTGPDVDLMHDAAGCDYSFDDALRVGRSLESLSFRWFEEPLPDRSHNRLVELCRALDVPVLAPETLMNDLDLSAQWLISGATDLIRANARVGATSILKLAHLAELHGTNVELNGPGGLFGLVHAHMMAALANTSYYEYFPGGTRDEAGREIGLTNPPVPVRGRIAPPGGPGWGAEWDMAYFEKRRVGVL